MNVWYQPILIMDSWILFLTLQGIIPVWDNDMNDGHQPLLPNEFWHSIIYLTRNSPSAMGIERIFDINTCYNMDSGILFLTLQGIILVWKNRMNVWHQPLFIMNSGILFLTLPGLILVQENKINVWHPPLLINGFWNIMSYLTKNLS